ncbi:hypothetical protein G7046_g447 [Stylonectria norvegica]|nr:hypothetical protein G7046_g447 [Stylonectria norvegica]
MIRNMAKLNLQSTIKLNSGYELPRLGFGVYQTPASQSKDICVEALKVGYRHIDSAVYYHNQGPSAAAIPASGVPRSEVFFTTKIPAWGEHPLSYGHTLELVDAALKETKLGYLDLVLIHAPYGGSQARKGAWKALVESVEAGKVRSIGVSNYGVHHLDELEKHIKELEKERGGEGKGGVISVGQWEIHPWLTRPDIFKWCNDRHIAVQAYCPIVRGQRFGEPKIKALADKYSKTEAQILLRWSLQRGYVPLVKTVTPSRVTENAGLYDFELTEAEVEDVATDEYSVIAWDPNYTDNTDFNLLIVQKLLSAVPRGLSASWWSCDLAAPSRRTVNITPTNAFRLSPSAHRSHTAITLAGLDDTVTMAGQKTFTLIPMGNRASPGPQTPVRPMTSKQVQKAYKAANKGPRLSRIERIKQEKAEQERIRKELDKERTAARAKNAREKKRGKELAQREDKRKKGLPLIEVRPSQPTIFAGFVRGNGSRKKRDSEGREFGLVEELKAIDKPASPAVESPGNLADDNLSDEFDNDIELDLLQGPELEVVEKPTSAEKSPPRAVDGPGNLEDQDIGDAFDDDIVLELLQVRESMVAQELKVVKPLPAVDSSEIFKDEDLGEEFEGDIDLDMLQGLETIAKEDPGLHLEHVNKDTNTHDRAAPNVATTCQDHGSRHESRYAEDLGLQRPMAVEPPSPRHLPVEQVLQKSPLSSPLPPQQAPPLSTQAILYNYDDFFPSSSQQARELDEEKQATQISPAKLPTPLPVPESPTPPPRRFFTSSGSHEQMCLALHRSRRTAALEAIHQRESMRVLEVIRERMRAEAGRHKRAKVEPKPRGVERKAAAVGTPSRATGALTKTAAECTKTMTTPMRASSAFAHAVAKPLKKTTAATATATITPHRKEEPTPKEASTVDTRRRNNSNTSTDSEKENRAPNPQRTELSASQETEYGGDWIDEMAQDMIF